MFADVVQGGLDGGDDFLGGLGGVQLDRLGAGDERGGLGDRGIQGAAQVDRPRDGDLSGNSGNGIPMTSARSRSSCSAAIIPKRALSPPMSRPRRWMNANACNTPSWTTRANRSRSATSACRASARRSSACSVRATSAPKPRQVPSMTMRPAFDNGSESNCPTCAIITAVMTREAINPPRQPRMRAIATTGTFCQTPGIVVSPVVADSGVAEPPRRHHGGRGEHHFHHVDAQVAARDIHVCRPHRKHADHHEREVQSSHLGMPDPDAPQGMYEGKHPEDALPRGR